MSDGGQTNLGVAPNIGGLLCYAPCCIGFVFSIVAAIVEKQSRFVRFHAFQSLLFHAVAIVLSIGIQVLSLAAHMVAGPLGSIVGLLSIPIGLGLLAATILLMIKAYNNEEWKLPVLGDMAQKWV